MCGAHDLQAAAQNLLTIYCGHCFAAGQRMEKIFGVECNDPCKMNTCVAMSAITLHDTSLLATDEEIVDQSTG